MTTKIVPQKGDTVTLLDGNGQATENMTIVEDMIFEYQEGVYEIEDSDGERFTVIRNASSDTMNTKGWLEFWMEEE